jgi:hypothetical protein
VAWLEGVFTPGLRDRRSSSATRAASEAGWRPPPIASCPGSRRGSLASLKMTIRRWSSAGTCTSTASPPLQDPPRLGADHVGGPPRRRAPALGTAVRVAVARPARRQLGDRPPGGRGRASTLARDARTLTGTDGRQVVPGGSLVSGPAVAGHKRRTVVTGVRPRGAWPARRPDSRVMPAASSTCAMTSAVRTQVAPRCSCASTNRGRRARSWSLMP